MQRVTQIKQVKLILHPRVRRVLGCFLTHEQTVSGAAQQTELDLRVVHRDVQALTAAALLRITREEARAGRAIRHYQASASAYFVPQSVYPSGGMKSPFKPILEQAEPILDAALEREFDRALHASGPREWGTRLFATDTGPETDLCFYDAELRNILSGWQGPQTLAFTGLMAVRLTKQESQEMQRAFHDLVMRLDVLGKANQAQDRGQLFGVRLMQVPLSEQERVAMNLPTR